MNFRGGSWLLAKTHTICPDALFLHFTWLLQGLQNVSLLPGVCPTFRYEQTQRRNLRLQRLLETYLWTSVHNTL